jgi:hypothetical protein
VKAGAVARANSAGGKRLSARFPPAALNLLTDIITQMVIFRIFDKILTIFIRYALTKPYFGYIFLIYDKWRFVVDETKPPAGVKRGKRKSEHFAGIGCPNPRRR